MKKLLLAGVGLLALGRVAAAQPYTPITNQASPTQVAGFVMLPNPGSLWSVSITTGATAGFLMLVDASAVPASGTVAPVSCWSVAASSSYSYVNVNGALSRFNKGIVALFSTTGCYTYTPSSTAFIWGQVQ